MFFLGSFGEPLVQSETPRSQGRHSPLPGPYHHLLLSLRATEGSAVISAFLMSYEIASSLPLLAMTGDAPRKRAQSILLHSSPGSAIRWARRFTMRHSLLAKGVEARESRRSFAVEDPGITACGEGSKPYRVSYSQSVLERHGPAVFQQGHPCRDPAAYHRERF